MSSFEKILTVINVIAIIIIPIVAVFIGQKLQYRSQQRKDKLDIFRVLMMNRGMGWTNETVKALNIIDIVFSDDDMVRKQWKEYYNKLGIESPDEMQRKQIQEAHDKLLEVMAHSLGYKKQITWETIQKPYIPLGMINVMLQQQNIQNGQEKLAAAADALLKKALYPTNNQPMSNVSVEQEADTKQTN